MLAHEGGRAQMLPASSLAYSHGAYAAYLHSCLPMQPHNVLLHNRKSGHTLTLAQADEASSLQDRTQSGFHVSINMLSGGTQRIAPSECPAACCALYTKAPELASCCSLRLAFTISGSCPSEIVACLYISSGQQGQRTRFVWSRACCL